MKIWISIPLMVLLTGCSASNPLSTHDTVQVNSHSPRITEPVRPLLDKLTPDDLTEYVKLPQAIRDKLEGNNTKLQTWADQLHIAIYDYNAWSVTNNSLSDESVGIKGK